MWRHIVRSATYECCCHHRRSSEPLRRDGLPARDDEGYRNEGGREQPPNEYPLNRKDPVWQMNMCHRQFLRGASLRNAQRHPTMCIILFSYSIHINISLLLE